MRRYFRFHFSVPTIGLALCACIVFVSLLLPVRMAQAQQIVQQCGDTRYILTQNPNGGSNACPETCRKYEGRYGIPISAFDETYQKCITEQGCIIACAVKTECTFCDILQMVRNVSSLIMRLMGGVAAILFIYGGILFIVNFGNADKIQRAKSLLVNTVLGIVIILFAWTVVNVGIAVLTSAPGTRTNTSILGKAWNQPLSCEPSVIPESCPSL